MTAEVIQTGIKLCSLVVVIFIPSLKETGVLKRAQENEVENESHYTDLVLPAKVKVTKSGIKWYKSMVSISRAGIQEFLLLKKFARIVQRQNFCQGRRTDNGRLNSRTQLTT